MTPLEEVEIQAYEVANKLKGLPTRESLKEAYLQFNFDRKAVADHFHISVARLNAIKKKLLGPDDLPSSPSYIRQWNEVNWYTRAFPKWTHIAPASKTDTQTFKFK